MVHALSAQELHAWLTGEARTQQPTPLVLDVREPWEVNLAPFPGALHIPMGQIPARLDDIDANQAVVCLCHHGARSMQVASYLDQQGVTSVFNLSGGIDAWSVLVDASITRY